MNVNKFIGIGRLGQDPELKQINQDFKVVNFSMAFSESYTNKSGEKVENTDWLNFQSSNRTAEVIEKYVKKGDQLYVEGKVKTRSWEKDGVKQYATFIQIDLVQLFPKLKQEEHPQSTQFGTNLPPTEYATQPPIEDDINSLPF